MTATHIQTLADELQLAEAQISATAALLADGATVPFLARYRKEATGSLDEVQIASIRDRLAQLADVDRRREAILRSLTDGSRLSRRH